MRTITIAVGALAVGLLGDAHAQKSKDKPKPPDTADAHKKPPPPDTDAGKPAPPAAPKPPDWSSVKFFLGNWKCTGTMTMGGNTIKEKLTFNAKADLDSFWIYFKGQTGKVKGMPPLKLAGYIGYDGSMWNLYSFDNNGVAEVGSSKGWDGDTLEWNPTYAAGGQKVTGNDTWKKKSDKQLEWSGKAGDMASWDFDCKK